MTINELIEEYDLDKNLSIDDLISRKEDLGHYAHPVVMGLIEPAFVIEHIWGHVANGNLSGGKARELTCYVIARYVEENK